jgi:hypothetical protein
MRKFTPLFLLLLTFFGFSQNSNKIAERINDYHQNGYSFENYSVFDKMDNRDLAEELSSTVNNVNLLQLNDAQIKKIYQDQPLLIQLSIPFNNNMIEVELYKKDILEESFKLTDENGINLNYKPGVYYRGVVKNSSQSVVAFSFFNNSVYGVASSTELGNINVGKLKDRKQYIAYAEQDLIGENPFICGFDEIEENLEKTAQQNFDTTNKSQALTTNCVRIYYEVAYEPYLVNNSNEQTTIDWVTSVHNNISTLFANDDIQIAMSEILLWTTEDPYIYDYAENLALFSEVRDSFNGDLGHLINQPTTTSVAYLNSLCTNYNYAYSAVSQFFDVVPTYSWTIGASTHELGHALGSPHTHACAWNGNGTAIDGCGEEAGYGEGCEGPIPNNGGTIMSYCHLMWDVGVNLSNGFGAQPGQLIRNTVDSSSCLGTDCITSCFDSLNDLYFTNITTNTTTVNIDDPYLAEWEYQIYPYDATPSAWTNTNTNTFNVENLLPNTYYIVNIASICSSGQNGGYISRIMLTNGDYCGGETFRDTGNLNGNYGDNQYIVKTFYPENTGDEVMLTFSQFNLELDYDFMSIYNGSSIDAPVFENGENLSGNLNLPPFTATNPEGAITIKFTSDQYLNMGGWNAEITCANLAADSFNKIAVNLYPNPANSIINITSEEQISAIIVYDIAGRKVLTKNNINLNKTELNVENLMSGAYFVNIQANGQSQTYKVIKE